ncbi:MAG: T9SS type A sorting domain-containing protein [Candidatus Eisenbacteria bacterium]|uniref:T9SS type A sorting domain-containing protein n=1 Tax=Eiseniibacteriota bacterium TaxID=2212470 RepID=A0A538SKI1_UNCEI|nr:MAG: T9SS type A sorting domain-containing protein [Candidatus Eisenbacteria bacterium]
MRGWGRALAVVVAACAFPSAVGASGAWTTLLRAGSYSDLLARGDTVWCATLDAGLLEFHPSTRRFGGFTREPGGLASNRLSALALDRSRRLWVATLASGVSVLSPDRSSWGVLNAFDGLPSDSVNAIEADGDTMWIGTAQGLALWNGLEITGTLPDATNPSPFANNNITGIVTLGDTLWVSTRNGIYRSSISAGLTSWTAVNGGLGGTSVESLASDGSSLFAHVGVAAYLYDRAAGQWTAVAGIGAVRRLSDDLGAVLAATGSGIYRFGPSGWETVTTAFALRSGGSPATNFAVTVDESGRPFAANRNGVYQRATDTAPWEPSLPPGPPGNNILNLEVVGTRLYLTTPSDGIGRFDGAQWKYWIPVGTLRSDTTFRTPAYPYAILTDKAGRIWFGTWAGLINTGLCQPDTGQMEVLEDDVVPPHFTHLLYPPDSANHTFARASSLDSAGGHWFGMDSPCSDQPARQPIGLDFYDSAGVLRATYNPTTSPSSGMRGNRVLGLAVDKHGRLWVGYAGQGVDYADPPSVPGGTPEFRHVAQTDQLFVRGLAAHGDSLWVATTSDLRRLSLSGTSRAIYTIPAQPSEDSVRPVDVARDGTVYLGTVNGVRVYRPDGTTLNFTTDNSPLADDEVRTIRIDPRTGAVWIATAGGLNRYEPGYVPPAPQVAKLRFQVYPNPARVTELGIALKLQGNATSYRGEVFDLSGRVLRRFSIGANGHVVWDGRDSRGELVKPGLYFVRAEAAGRSGVARVVLVR